MNDTAPKSVFIRIALLILGWILIILGIAGLFLPILQGVLLIVAGLWVLSLESKTARRLLEKLRHKFPRIDAKLTAWQSRWHARLDRWRKKRWKRDGENGEDR